MFVSKEVGDGDVTVVGNPALQTFTRQTYLLLSLDKIETIHHNHGMPPASWKSTGTDH